MDDGKLRRSRTAWAALTALIGAFAACATNPATGQREFSLMSEAQEIALGQESDVQVRGEMGVYDDDGLQKLVSDIGLELARRSERPNLQWKFAVVDTPAINAFALPGGFIYIARGILPFFDSEAELAGVLGHEIGHITARHSAQQYSRATGAQLGVILGSILVPQARPLGELAQSGLGVLFLKYGRDDELQADQLGVRYTAAAGYDPAGVGRMLGTLDRVDDASDSKGIPNWLSTHPAPADRVERVRAAIADAAVGGAPARGTDRDQYLRRIDGLVYGDNPAQGVVRGSRFLHPGLRLALDFPDRWQVQNSASQVAAKQPDANVFMVLQMVQRAAGRTLEETAIRSMRDAGFRPIDGAATSINGLEAFVATYEGSMSNLGRVGVRAAHISHDRRIFLVAGIATAQQYDRAASVFDRALRSFQPVTQAEAERIQPDRIDVYTVRDHDTWTSIAERQGKGAIKPGTLAIMNGHREGEPPRPGDRLKVVVGG